MDFNKLVKRPICVALVMFAAFSHPVFAQSAEDEVERMANQIKDLMEQLETRTEEFPPFLEELEQGLVDIEQAQERVAGLIENLREATTQMEDGSAFDEAIDRYKEETIALIAEADASNNNAIKEAIPELEETLANLEEDDVKRSSTVAEARNLIRTLEENEEALVFFIKARQVKRAAASIRENVDEFQTIVENGKVLAESLLEGASP